ncbi:MAG: TetR/AcrR family transcriptional regulator [Chlorobi bacterium]|nr:TetR/AcrR family transcriptional regulator [Chlorobiota bacterium]
MVENDEKLDLIISGSYRIFTEQGLRNVSMDDICRSIGISKKTLYLYVDNKLDLLKKIVEYIRTQIHQRIKELEGRNLNAIDVLLEMSKIANTKHFRINPVISFEFRKYYPKAFEEFIFMKKELIIEHIIKNIKQGINEGLYRHDLNIEIVAHLYFQKIEDFHKLELDDLEDFSYRKVFEVMFENHIRGIANAKGIAYFEKQKEKLNFNI